MGVFHIHKGVVYPLLGGISAPYILKWLIQHYMSVFYSHNVIIGENLLALFALLLLTLPDELTFHIL